MIPHRRIHLLETLNVACDNVSFDWRTVNSCMPFRDPAHEKNTLHMLNHFACVSVKKNYSSICCLGVASRAFIFVTVKNPVARKSSWDLLLIFLMSQYQDCLIYLNHFYYGFNYLRFLWMQFLFGIFNAIVLIVRFCACQMTKMQNASYKTC